MIIERVLYLLIAQTVKMKRNYNNVPTSDFDGRQFYIFDVDTHNTQQGSSESDKKEE